MTSYWLSIETLALSCLVFEKTAFCVCVPGDRHTNKKQREGYRHRVMLCLHFMRRELNNIKHRAVSLRQLSFFIVLSSRVETCDQTVARYRWCLRRGRQGHVTDWGLVPRRHDRQLSAGTRRGARGPVVLTSPDCIA